MAETLVDLRKLGTGAGIEKGGPFDAPSREEIRAARELYGRG